METFRAKMDDRDFVFRQAFGGFEHMDRLEPYATDHTAFGRQLDAPDSLEWRYDLAPMAVVSVVFVTDDHQVRRLRDRLIAAAVRRPIWVHNDPQAFGLDKKRSMSIPGDSHGVVSGDPRSVESARRPRCAR